MADEIVLFFDETMILHEPGLHHPERPQRLEAIKATLADHERVRWKAPEPVHNDAILRVHKASYLEFLERFRGDTMAFDTDTVASPRSMEAAWLASGAVVDATRSVVQGDAKRAFALVRPPGHHAEAGRAMGFCFLNHVAIAAEYALAELDCQKVMIVDWDVHHGNGTQHSFMDRSDVLVFNVHQHPYYPGTGALELTGNGDGAGRNVNVPLPAGCGDGDYSAVFEQLLVPIAETFEPDLILVSAGFDAHRDDPLANMHVSEEGFASMCGIVCDLADRLANGRVALTLEGGYDLDGLARSVHACVDVLCNTTPPEFKPNPTTGKSALKQARETHRMFWPV